MNFQDNPLRRLMGKILKQVENLTNQFIAIQVGGSARGPSADSGCFWDARGPSAGSVFWGGARGPSALPTSSSRRLGHPSDMARRPPVGPFPIDPAARGARGPLVGPPSMGKGMLVGPRGPSFRASLSPLASACRPSPSREAARPLPRGSDPQALPWRDALEASHRAKLAACEGLCGPSFFFFDLFSFFLVFLFFFFFGGTNCF